MGQRGPKSASSMSVVPSGVLEAKRRPQPPESLDGERAACWNRIVSAMPAEWFTAETHDVLVQYCRHVVTADRVDQLIEAMHNNSEFDPSEYNQLLIMQDRESRALTTLATKMRLTQQATYSARKGKGSGKTIPSPWTE